MSHGRPIWFYLAVFAIGIIVPALSGSIYLLYRYANVERQIEHAHLQADASSLAGMLNREISNNLTTLRVLAASQDLDQGDLAAFHARASAALRDTGYFVLLLDRSLKHLLNTRVAYGEPLAPPKDRATPTATLRDGRPHVSGIFVGNIAKQPVINVTMPVARRGTIQYVLILTRNALSLAASINAQLSQTTSVVSLVDSDGRIIAHSKNHNDQVTRRLSPAMAAALQGTRGVSATEDDGVELLVAHETLQIAPWRVVLSRPMAEVEANLDTSLSLLIASGGGLLAVSLLCAFQFGRFMAMPMRDLAKQGRALGGRSSIKPLASHLKEANEVSAVLAQAASDREQHERHIGLLIGELRHRSRNQFAIIQALMTLTAKHCADLEDFQQRFLPRVRSLSDSLELLDTKEWQGVDITKLVRTQIRSFDDIKGSRITISGPPIHIDSQAAQSLGLALHELATNAAKYGALSGQDGQVTIEWGERPASEGQDVMFWMRWQELGGPPVKQPTRRGFGSTVVDRMVCRSTDGEVTLTFDPAGVVWRFECVRGNLAKNLQSPLKSVFEVQA